MEKKKNLLSPDLGTRNPELPRPSQGSFMHISDSANGDFRDRRLVSIIEMSCTEKKKKKPKRTE